MQLPIPKVNLLTVNRDRLNTSWQAADNQHPFARWYYVLGGSGEIHHSHQDFQLRGGQLYLIPSHTSMTYRCHDYLDICWFHFQALLPGGLDLFNYLACDYQVAAAAEETLLRPFARLLEIATSHELHDRLEATGILLQLLAPIVATADPEHQRERHRDVMRFQPVIAYIERHLTDQVRIPELAALAHLEVTYFTTRFGELFGQTPLRYLHQRRMERAMLRLQESDCTLAQLAQELGYTDAFHFSRTFKKITGQAPRDFRLNRRVPVP